jgi:hypothetical protein
MLSSPVHRDRDGHPGPTEPVRLVSRLCNPSIPAESPDGRPAWVRRHRENGAHGPDSVRQPAGHRLIESGPPQASGVLPDQVR